MSNKISSWLSLTAVLAMFLTIGQSASGQGCRPPTAAEQAWWDANAIQVKKVYLNQTGLSLLNADRVSRGLSLLTESQVPVAPDGAEVDGQSADGTKIVKASVTVPAAMTLQSTAAPLSLPTFCDNSKNSNKKYFPKVFDQNPLLSCVGFATTYYAMTYTVAKTNNWDVQNDTSYAYTFSPKFTYNLLNGGKPQAIPNVPSICIQNAFQLLYQHGALTWKDFPYDGRDYYSWPIDAASWRKALKHKMAYPKYIDAISTADGLQSVKTELANGRVMTFFVNVDNWDYWNTANIIQSASDSSVLGQRVVCTSNSAAGNHAMTVVGYDDAMVIKTGSGKIVTGALKVCNSWGASWPTPANGGFIYVAYDAITTFHAFSGDKVYYQDARGVGEYTASYLAEFQISDWSRYNFNISFGYGEPSSTLPNSGSTSKPDILQPEPQPATFNVNLDFGGVDKWTYSNDVQTNATFVVDCSDISLHYYPKTRLFLTINNTDSSNGHGTSLRYFRLTDGTPSYNRLFDAGAISPPTLTGATYNYYVDVPLCNVTVNNGKVNDGSGAAGGDYPSGVSVPIIATVPSGQTFSHWIVTSGSPVIANPKAASTTVTTSAGVVSVSAVCDYVLEGGITSEINGVTINVGGDSCVGKNSAGNGLTIDSAGVLNVTGSSSIGDSALANNNSVTVTGAGSAWINTADLYVGNSGSYNRLILNNSGKVAAANLVVGKQRGCFSER